MKSVEFFQQAIEHDPGYALAWAGLADSFLLLGLYSWMPPAEAYPRAREAASRAIELEETLAEPHTSLAYLKTVHEWDWPGAEREFRRAIELNPEYGTAHHWYADHLVAVGRLAEALAERRRAREVEPLSLIINAEVGHIYYYARQYEQAVQESRKAVEIDPAFSQSHQFLGMAYALQRRQKEAKAELEQAINLSHRGLFALAQAGSSFAFLGQREEAQKLLQELLELSRKRYVGPHLPAMIYANLGERDRAFEYFDKALQERSLLPEWLRDPLLDGLRSDPRFQSLLQRMGLPP
jgi:tetratricopeptide (TPR) repeat protein